MSFYNIKKIKSARKEYTCGCCASKILPKEPYERHCGVYEERFFSFKICPVCSKILDYYIDNVDTEFCLTEIIDALWCEPEIQALLNQIKHPSKLVTSIIAEYNECYNNFSIANMQKERRYEDLNFVLSLTKKPHQIQEKLYCEYFNIEEASVKNFKYAEEDYIESIERRLN